MLQGMEVFYVGIQSMLSNWSKDQMRAPELNFWKTRFRCFRVTGWGQDKPFFFCLFVLRSF